MKSAKQAVDDSVCFLFLIQLFFIIYRLGLERAKSAKQAVDVVSQMLEKHGQGGACSDAGGAWSYHNSFIIADQSEAWVLETAGKIWAAECITSMHVSCLLLLIYLQFISLYVVSKLLCRDVDMCN